MKGSTLFLYFRKIKKPFLMVLLCFLIFGIVFCLWDIPNDAYFYALFLTLFTMLVAVLIDFFMFRATIKRILLMRNASLHSLEEQPVPAEPIAEAYRDLLTESLVSHERSASEANLKQADLLDYYSMWVHQIKSPIAAMRLILQSTQDMNRRTLTTELFRIEQYVDMALQYMRLESMSSDLLLKKQNILPVIRQSVRKFAPIFIEKRLILDLEESDIELVTDEKWIAVVFDQVISNALKYTTTGKIRIYRNPDVAAGIIVEDSGAGIRPEDLPRVFERGFTGYNGRTDKRATGLGLYLAKKIMDRLSHKIWITSDGSTGTFVYMDFSQIPYENES